MYFLPLSWTIVSSKKIVNIEYELVVTCDPTGIISVIKSVFV